MLARVCNVCFYYSVQEARVTNARQLKCQCKLLIPEFPPVEIK